MRRKKACLGMTLWNLYQTLVKHIISVLLVGVFAISCNAPQENRAEPEDIEVINQAVQTLEKVDSLVASGEPDPVAWLQSPEYITTNPGLIELFRKYVGLVHYFHEYRKDYNSALIYADSTLQLFEEPYDEPNLQAFHLYAILQKGDRLRALHLYGTSVQYYMQGWQMMDPEQTPCLANEILSRMGSMSYQQGNYPGSIEFYTQARQKSYDCFGKVGFEKRRLDYQYFQNVASNYEQLNIPDSALHYNNLSLEVINNDSLNALSDPDQLHFIELAKAVALGNKAAVLLESGRKEEAETLWKESIRINLKSGFATEHAQLMRLHLANYYIDEGRMEEADELLASVRGWLDRVKSDTGERRWQKARWRWLDKMGSRHQAYIAFQQYVELQEIANENREKAGAIDLAAQIRLTEQQGEIAQLLTDREIRNAYLASAVIISVMAIVILFLIWRNWQTSKKNVKQLTRLNKTILNQNLQLEENNYRLSTIMNVVTHDLRSPLVGVTELSAVMLEDQKLTDKHRKWLKLMHETVSRSLKLAKEILNANYLPANFNNLQKKPVDIHKLLEGCVTILQMLAKEKNQVLQLEVDERVLIALDINEMTRVINNIVVNAIKFSPEGSTIFIKVERHEGKVLLSIRDEGIGIPVDLKESVFDTFSIAKRPGTNNEQSFGLGLSISRQIVHAHGGTIWLESTDEIGTTFYIELPYTQEKLSEIYE